MSFTASVVSSSIAVVGLTLFKHYLTKQDPENAVEARKQLQFDEAFHIVKSFMKVSTKHTIEQVQSFTSTYTPHPPWVVVVPVVIPSTTLSGAAVFIQQYLGTDCQKVAGGTEWWQRRARSDGGLAAEWISMRRDYDPSSPTEQEIEERIAWRERIRDKIHKKQQQQEKKKHTQDAASSENQQDEQDDNDNNYEEIDNDDEEDVPPDAPLPETMDNMITIFYIHGGGYLLGSINTHRYTLWRYARKVHGRVFAPRYRLAPQYPWPCALQDVLASYLYLTRPPPEAKHRAVDPSKIVISGDSAGAALALCLLCLLRDMDITMPSAGVLISPWCDLTHSFPSIIQNTATDILPPYGFIYKPSVLWPPPSFDFLQRLRKTLSVNEIQRRATEKSENHHKKSSMSSISTLSSCLPLKLSMSKKLDSDSTNTAATTSVQAHGITPTYDEPVPMSAVEPPSSEITDGNTSSLPPQLWSNSVPDGDEDEDTITVKCESGEIITLKDQIQLYARNSQLTHPTVSPLFQPSLGGLPDLLVIAGDKEVLRDEIIYMAHRAAHPDKYPLKDSLRKNIDPKRLQQADKYPPTRVHLQVFDDMPHVLVLFGSLCASAKYAYRSIARFIKSSVDLGLEDDLTTTNGEKAVDEVDEESDEDEDDVLDDKEILGVPSSDDVKQESSQSHYEDEKKNQDHWENTDNKESIAADGNRAATKDKEKEDDTTSPVKNPISNPNANMSSESSSASRQSTKFSPALQAPKVAQPKNIFQAYRKIVKQRVDNGDDADKRLHKHEKEEYISREAYLTANPSTRLSFTDNMIRDRVSIQGIVRPLEAESDIPALNIPIDDVGTIRESTVRRYLQGLSLRNKRFSREIKRVAKHREKSLLHAQQKETRRFTKEQQQQQKDKEDSGKHEGKTDAADNFKKTDSSATSSASFLSRDRRRKASSSRVDDSISTTHLVGRNGSFDLHGENPPPSSIVARVDVKEGLELARALEQRPQGVLATWSTLMEAVWLFPNEHQKQKQRNTHLITEYSPSSASETNVNRNNYHQNDQKSVK